MKWLSLTLQGFRSYRGFTTVEFPTDVLLTAGPNGSGKSSLWLAALWALFGEAVEIGADDVVHEEADSCSVALEFELEGSRYLVSRSRRRGQPDASLYRGDQLLAQGHNEVTARIEELTGITYQYALAGPVFAQGLLDNVIAASSSDRIRLFADVLTGGLWERLSTAAKERREDPLRLRVASLETAIGHLQEEAARVGEIEAELAGILEREAGAKAALAAAEATEEEAHARLVELEGVKATAEGLRRERQAMAVRLAELATARQRLQRALAGWGELLAQEDEIIAGYSRLQRVREAGEAQSQKLTLLRAVEAELGDLEKRVDEAAQKAKRAAIAALRGRLDDLNILQGAAKGHLDERHGQARTIRNLKPGAACPTCRQPITEDHVEWCLGVLADEIDGLESSYGDATDHLAKLQAQMAELEARPALSFLEDAELHQALQAKQAEAEAVGFNQAALDAARRKYAELRPYEDRHRQLQTAQDGRARDEARQAEVDLEAEAVEARQAEVDLEAEALAGDLADYDRTRQAHQDAQSSRRAAERDLADTQANRARADAALQRAREAEEKLEGQAEELDQAQRDLALWQDLRRAYGPYGVPAMVVGEAVPVLERRVNEWLDRLAGGYMRFRFQLELGKAGRGKLDFIVSTPASTRDLRTFSGGERVRAYFAFRLGLAAFFAERAGRPWQTLVLDEVFESQDEAGLDAMVEIVAELRRWFGPILIATHITEARDLFPLRWEVERGPAGSRVIVPDGAGPEPTGQQLELAVEET